MQSELRSFFSDVRVFGWERLHSDSSNQPTEVFDRATRTQAPSDPTVGSQWSFSGLKDQEYPVAFGNYELLSEIDRGGMGIVFRALHKPLERLVALKVIRAGELASDTELQRFCMEAEVAAKLKHPNILPIYEVGKVNGLFYFTMALVDGNDLAQRLKQHEYSPRDAVRLMVKIADAVAAAHRFNIIHRDLKPSNILIDPSGEPFLIDFGLAKLQVHEKENDLTRTGQIVGTPAYMSPEQASGRGQLGPQVDVYALGAVLYTMVTRQPPFSGATPFDVLIQVMHREPPSPRKLNHLVHRDLERIIHKAIAKDTEHRYPSAEALQADLQRYLRDEPIQWSTESPLERFASWWRREPVLVSHLIGVGAALFIILISSEAWYPPVKIGLLGIWLLGAWVLQRLANVDRWREWAHRLWGAFDVVIYSLLIYLADAPRGLLLIGFPLLIVASGLFYRLRYVIEMTAICLTSFMVLWVIATDELSQRIDYALIYASGMVLLGACLISMIRRVRSLTDYYQS